MAEIPIINVQDITVDIMNNKTSDYIYSKQYDKLRKIRFIVTENGSPIDISNVHCIFTMKNDDGTVAYAQATKEGGVYFSIILDAVHTAKSGKIPYQLIITDTEVTHQGNTWNWSNKSEIIGTVTSYMLVEKCVINEDDIEYDYSSFAEQILNEFSRAGELLTRVENLWDELQDTTQVRIASAESEVSSIQKVNDIWIQPYN